MSERLYRGVNLGPLLTAPHDYLGEHVAAGTARGWNPTAFFPTPHNVVELMVRMTMHDARKDGVGSGREDPFHQSALQRLARRPGVSAHDDRERSRRSTMQDHGGRPAQAERELGREVASVDAANPVRSEEPSHAR